MSIVSINPATEKRLASYRAFSARQIETILARAERAQVRWRDTPLAERASALRALGSALRKAKQTLAATITAEMGKPISQALAEVDKCALCCGYHAEHAQALLQPDPLIAAPAEGSVRYAPLGVVLAIMPWNFPLWQVFRAAIPAVLAGNTVVVKHASNVSACALACEKLARQAGLAPGILQVVVTPNRRVPELIRDPRVRGITLTGSTHAGKQVATLAGDVLKTCVFELGGSDAYLILEDADLDSAAEVCAAARLVNAGQSCVAAKRFVVVGRTAEEFASRLAERMNARVPADPTLVDTQLGPLARADLREELQAQVLASIAAGARCLTGGRLPDRRGWYYPPTVLSRVGPGMPAYDQELFGPVASVIRARNEAHAVAIANDTVFGLGSAIFTRDLDRARRLIPSLEAGMVFINDSVRSEVSLPFGGVKQSGYGRELGAWGVRSFVNVKTIWEKNANEKPGRTRV